jgi:hypothetical protein
MSDPLGGRLMGVDHHDVLVDLHTNVMDDRHDRMMVVKTDVNLFLRMSDLLDDRNLDDDRRDALDDHHKNVMDDPSLGVNLLNRNCVRHDLNLVVMTDVNLCLRMNDLLAGHLMDGSHVNRNYAPHDLTMDANLDAMNPRVKLMDDLNRSCDRMSHDHLRYDRLKLRHRDTNRKVGMNLDGTMKIHRGCHPKTDDLMKGDHLMACLMKI